MSIIQSHDFQNTEEQKKPKKNHKNLRKPIKLYETLRKSKKSKRSPMAAKGTL